MAIMNNKKGFHVIISRSYEKHTQYDREKYSINGCLQHINKTLQDLALHCERPNRPPLHISITPTVLMKIADVRGERFYYTLFHSEYVRNCLRYFSHSILKICSTYLRNTSTFSSQLCCSFQTKSTKKTIIEHP